MSNVFANSQCDMSNVFANSQCDIPAVQRVSPLVMITDTTVPDPPADILACVATTAPNLEPEFPCPAFPTGVHVWNSTDTSILGGSAAKLVSPPNQQYGNEIVPDACCGIQALNQGIRFPFPFGSWNFDVVGWAADDSSAWATLQILPDGDDNFTVQAEISFPNTGGGTSSDVCPPGWQLITIKDDEGNCWNVCAKPVPCPGS
jgi:hypothetical protein